MRQACRGRALSSACALLFCASLLGGCGPTTSRTADDATISTRVKIELLNDPQLGSRRIDARTFQGVVTLTGTVASQAEADRAIAVARRVTGAKDVKSELKIVP